MHDSGLVISRHHPWLAASPDGIIVTAENELIILELKCPASGRRGPIKVDFLVDGKLKTSHAYYAQVQIQLLACGANMCHFFVYASKEPKKNSILLAIERDDVFL